MLPNIVLVVGRNRIKEALYSQPRRVLLSENGPRHQCVCAFIS